MKAVEHRLYKKLQLNEDAHKRMLAGTEKYGNSWAEVDLREDLIEELLDAWNYLILIEMRLSEQTHLVLPDQKLKNFLVLAAGQINSLIEATKKLPSFEGPTSNEWVKKNVVQ